MLSLWVKTINEHEKCGQITKWKHVVCFGPDYFLRWKIMNIQMSRVNCLNTVVCWLRGGFPVREAAWRDGWEVRGFPPTEAANQRRGCCGNTKLSRVWFKHHSMLLSQCNTIWRVDTATLRAGASSDTVSIRAEGRVDREEPLPPSVLGPRPSLRVWI